MTIKHRSRCYLNYRFLHRLKGEDLCKINEHEICIMNNHIYHCTNEEISILRQYVQRIGIPFVYGIN